MGTGTSPCFDILYIMDACNQLIPYLLTTFQGYYFSGAWDLMDFVLAMITALALIARIPVRYYEADNLDLNFDWFGNNNVHLCFIFVCCRRSECLSIQQVASLVSSMDCSCNTCFPRRACNSHDATRSTRRPATKTLQYIFI